MANIPTPNLNPQFEINEKAYVFNNNKIREADIVRIELIIDPNIEGGIRIKYHGRFGNPGTSATQFNEDQLYKTKAGCAINWLKDQNVNTGDVLQAYLKEKKEI